MERYVKVNRKVAEFLHLENDRTMFADGCFLLWMQDIMVFGSLINFQGILAQIGAVALDGDAAREEQDGKCTHLLPVATDERFIIEETPEENTGDSETGDQESSGSAGDAADTESTGESADKDAGEETAPATDEVSSQTNSEEEKYE
nr:MAG TPA: hypothetical protein [Caudoviricetes sp.]